MPYSMTGEARMLALIDAVRCCVARDVPEAFESLGGARSRSILAEFGWQTGSPSPEG